MARGMGVPLTDAKLYGLIHHILDPFPELLMARAIRRFYEKSGFEDGAIMEMVIWELPDADPERQHKLKYSLYYGKNGERLVGYDNERGKGDHRHYQDFEEPYEFVSPEKLIADFLADIARIRSEG
jgi:hypothetical protein